MDIPCSEARKLCAQEIAQAVTTNHANTLYLFCHGASLSNKVGTPIAIAACTANYRGKITEMLTKTLGLNSSTRDAAFHTLSLATALACHLQCRCYHHHHLQVTISCCFHCLQVTIAATCVSTLPLLLLAGCCRHHSDVAVAAAQMLLPLLLACHHRHCLHIIITVTCTSLLSPLCTLLSPLLAHCCCHCLHIAVTTTHMSPSLWMCRHHYCDLLCGTQSASTSSKKRKKRTYYPPKRLCYADMRVPNQLWAQLADERGCNQVQVQVHLATARDATSGSPQSASLCCTCGL